MRRPETSPSSRRASVWTVLELGNKERSTKAGQLKVKELRGTTRVLKSYIVLTGRSFVVEKPRYLRKGWGGGEIWQEWSSRTHFIWRWEWYPNHKCALLLEISKCFCLGASLRHLVSTCLQSVHLVKQRGFQQCMSPTVSAIYSLDSSLPEDVLMRDETPLCSHSLMGSSKTTSGSFFSRLPLHLYQKTLPSGHFVATSLNSLGGL